MLQFYTLDLALFSRSGTTKNRFLFYSIIVYSIYIVGDLGPQRFGAVTVDPFDSGGDGDDTQFFVGKVKAQLR